MSSVFSRIAAVSVCILLSSAAIASAGSITLAWDASSGGPVAGYVLLRGTRAGVYTTAVDVGNQTGWTFSDIDPNQRYYFAVQAYTASRIYSPLSLEISNDSLVVNTNALLVDRRPSLFWRHEVTGDLMTWQLNDNEVVDTDEVSIYRNADTNWKVVGTGDLNGDGSADILWRHEPDGWLAAWLLQNNQVIATPWLSINRQTDRNWRIAGVGDINGDLYADIVWQHSDGLLAAWLMRGTDVIQTSVLSVARAGDPRWQVAAVADINGDRMADLIWRDPAGGWLAAWILHGTTVVWTQFFSISLVADTDWVIRTAGYLDGSGRPTIVWQHKREGWVAIWHVSGFTVTGTKSLNPSRVEDLNWTIVGAR